MAPAWPSSGGIKLQDKRLPGSGGVLASLPPTKIHPTRYQGLDDARIQRRTRGGQGGGTGETEGPTMIKPSIFQHGTGHRQRATNGEAQNHGNDSRRRHAARIAEMRGRGWIVAGMDGIQMGSASRRERRWR